VQATVARKAYGETTPDHDYDQAYENTFKSLVHIPNKIPPPSPKTGKTKKKGGGRGGETTRTRVVEKSKTIITSYQRNTKKGHTSGTHGVRKTARRTAQT
jgi:hypothetical protein